MPGFRLFQKGRRPGGVIPNKPFYEADVTLIPKPQGPQEGNRSVYVVTAGDVNILGTHTRGHEVGTSPLVCETGLPRQLMGSITPAEGTHTILTQNKLGMAAALEGGKGLRHDSHL